MNLHELYRLIELWPEMIEKLQKIENAVDLNALEVQLSQMTDRKTAASGYRALRELFKDDTENLKMLYCQLECARRTYQRYQERNIPDIIFIDTMKCFSRFISECKKRTGRLYYDRGWWSYRQISMGLFRIGALEYEFEEYEEEKVISLHIPSDADLSPACVDDSLARAKAFFRNFYPEYSCCRYICDSWLLSPVLASLLPKSSRILAFQQRFELLKSDTENKEFIEWLFQSPQNTPYADLPEDTSLQRSVRQLLLDGGCIGTALGIMRTSAP